jgi:hypothetical protein
MENQPNTNTVETDVAPTATPPATQEAGLALNDLASVVQLIDVCSRRGAFEGAELAAVGGLRNRISDFLKANTPKDQAKAEPEAPAAPQA